MEVLCVESSTFQRRMPSTLRTKSTHIHRSLRAHWRTDTLLGSCYPRHNNTRTLDCQKRFSGLYHLLCKRNRLVKSHRHGMEAHECGCRAIFDMPTEISEDAAQSVKGLELSRSSQDFLVVSFYHFIRIEDPQEEVARHRSFLEGRDVKGRIYINEQGINAQYSGPLLDTLAYAKWVKEDTRFKHILVQMSPSSTHAFPRLKLRYKSSLVQVEGGASHLPLLDPSMRAMPLSPKEWKDRLTITNRSKTGCDEISAKGKISSDQGRKLLLLDVRNGYEWDIGHFQGAKRPDVDCFRNTALGISDEETNTSDPLAELDKEKTDILMYCTGGIRCDVYSVRLRERGFQNLYTLKGGITNYLKEEGPVKWIGNLFVFDSRLSVSPKMYKPMHATNNEWTGSMNGGTQDYDEYLALQNSTFGRCHLCKSPVSEMRHRNCANLDCNRLILSCKGCVEEFKGCCSTACISAPRIRPIFYDSQRYERWHIYRDSKY